MLRYFLPFLDSEVKHWAFEARLLRWLTFLWLCIGLVAMFSASYPVADLMQKDGLFYVKRQIVWILVGLFCFNVVVRSPLKSLCKVSGWLLMFAWFLIILTIIPGIGTEVLGATRWIALGPVKVQPSEFAKPFLILQAAQVFGRWRKLRWDARFGWLCVFAGILGCILIQPNLSTTALCAMTIWFIAVAAGLPWINLGSTAVVGLMTAIVSISAHEYQRRRLMFFLDPFIDARGQGYQLVQSLLAIGSGGGWGVGFGLSQQKLFYLPIQHTDFIFAVFAEEFGFIGCFSFLLLLLFYASVGTYVALRSQNLIKRLVAMGATFALIGQSLLNIGVTTGVLPTTGLPLPLFSYGGSSVISSLICAALLVRVARESKEAQVVSMTNRRQRYKRGSRSFKPSL
ncbi:MAG: FtsW/RodA/SpoVE family cell cycle protein [Limnothrix sp. RL_2_0]|nr:FtsW/RodA/SpoVE family cell cycle protein [Limnothrix sp. RL_2_0]